MVSVVIEPSLAEKTLLILKDVQCDEYTFVCTTKPDGCVFLLAEYYEQCIVTKKVEKQKTRKWYISPYATTSEIVQTAFKCILTSMEHRTREMFLYKGKRIFGPHYDVDKLHELCKSKEAYDYREVING